MSYYNLCDIGSQHSNISKGKRGVGEGVHIKIYIIGINWLKKFTEKHSIC